MLHHLLKSLRNSLHQLLAKMLPWDTKFHRLEAKLVRLEALIEQTHARVNLALDDRTFIADQFTRAHGFVPNLDQPATFNEKLAWIKLHRRDSHFAELSDKSQVKSYVGRILGPEFVIPSLAEHDSVNALDFAALPESFILKPNHGSGWTCLVPEKSRADKRAIRQLAHAWMRTNYYAFQREPQYLPLIPRLIVEPLLKDAQGKLPADYKFHCFHGRAAFVQVDTDRHSAHRRSFYDRGWTLQSFDFAPANDEGAPAYPRGIAQARPEHFARLLEAAEKLAAPFDYVRVDLYLVDARVYFGELTFMPGAGAESFFPRRWDLIWGDLWQLELPA